MFVCKEVFECWILFEVKVCDQHQDTSSLYGELNITKNLSNVFSSSEGLIIYSAMF